LNRYRSKPVEVGAFQFDPYGVHRKLPDGIVGMKVEGSETIAFVVSTVLGPRPIAAGDWIVVTDDGNWRACEREAFEQGFVPVEPACMEGCAGSAGKSRLLLPRSMREN
jgi:hypothetical protein